MLLRRSCSKVLLCSSRIVYEVRVPAWSKDFHVGRGDMQYSSATAAPTASRTKGELDFSDHNKAFQGKSAWELVRAVTILKLCSSDRFVAKSFQLMSLGQKILGKRLFAAFMKPTFYGQFISGSTPKELKHTATALRRMGVRTLGAVPLEEDVGVAYCDATYDTNVEKMVDLIKLASEVQKEFPVTHMRLTPLLSGDLTASLSKWISKRKDVGKVAEKISQAMMTGAPFHDNDLTDEQIEQVNKGIQRCQRIGEVATESDVVVLVDAEYTYMNPCINLMTLAMMLTFNKKKPLIAYTYQNYLKCTANILDHDLQFIESKGVCFAAKVVRGAYIQSERALVTKHGSPDTVHATYEDTTRHYYATVEKLMKKIAKSPDKYFMIVATHNSDTVQFAADLMKKYNISRENTSLVFGQVVGICDHVTFTLAQSGYIVYKATQYGTVEETIGYLSRRALENQTVFTTTVHEQAMIWAALRDRLLRRSVRVK